MSAHSPTLWKILSDAGRLIAARRRHFSVLAALFLLPISLFPIVYQFLSLKATSTPPQPHLLISILYILATTLFPLCANASITYTTFAAFYDRPVSIFLSLKAIVASFFPLLITFFTTSMVFALITLVFVLLVLVSYTGLEFLGPDMDYDSPFFLGFAFLAAVVFVLVMFYLQVEWCLWGSVVVLESKWGFEPLRRSSYLVKGMRKVALYMALLFALIGGVLTVWYSNFVAKARGDCKGWAFLLHVVFYVVFSTVYSLYGLVAMAVLYIYCKASHEESPAVIDEETGGEYMALHKA